jgi:hypothetical protein
MLSTYKTKEDFLGAVSSHIQQQQPQADVTAALLSGISSAEDAVREEQRDEKSQAFHLKLGSWVIRDEDIPIFDAVNSSAAAVVTTLTTAGMPWVAIATAVTGLAHVCWRAWRKGARLSGQQVSVYGLLRAQGPMTAAALTAALRNTGKDVKEEDVGSTLESLTEIELNDGEIIELASKDDNQRWKALKI